MSSVLCVTQRRPLTRRCDESSTSKLISRVRSRSSLFPSNFVQLMSFLEYHVFTELLINAHETLVTVHSKGSSTWSSSSRPSVDSWRHCLAPQCSRFYDPICQNRWQSLRGRVLPEGEEWYDSCLRCRPLARTCQKTERSDLLCPSLFDISPYHLPGFAEMVSPNTITAFLTLVSLKAIFGVEF